MRLAHHGVRLLALLILASCADSAKKDPLSSGGSAGPHDKVLRGDYTIDSQESLSDLASKGGESFLITGNLAIQNSDLTELVGLDGLTSVGGDLLISDNASLFSLRGLGNLETITGFLDIGTNANLRDLDGLNQLRRVGSFLIVGFNSSMTDIDGLSNLSHVGTVGIQILLNPVLANVDGLRGITAVGDLSYLEESFHAQS